jgi:hypothetical protein
MCFTNFNQDCYTLKPHYRGTRTNTTLDAYRIGTRYEDYDVILYYNLIRTSMPITQQF